MNDHPSGHEDNVLSKSGAAQKTRRRFLHDAGVVIASGTIGLTVASCDSDSNDPDPDPGGNEAITVAGNVLSIDLTRTSALNNAGGFLLVSSVGGASVKTVIVNTDGTNFKAFTSVCTHQQCDLNSFDADDQNLVCPCHGSRFDLTGAAVTGPATGTLQEFATSRTGDTLTVTFR